MTHGRKLSKAEREARRVARAAPAPPAAAEEQAATERVLSLTRCGKYAAATLLADATPASVPSLVRELAFEKRFRQAAHHCRSCSAGMADGELRALIDTLTCEGEWLGAATLSHARALAGDGSVDALALMCAAAPVAAGGGAPAALEVARVGGTRVELELARMLLRYPHHRLRP
ncbi:hypothetical protein T492DRAFT_353304 [Pavlovales sp. CCMP2436]|nr:hypothetical protein T492DRAFT_353304 [Pavlovales sp. CCMP2436]